jgi:DNA-binding CsgD family transcriptional regulator
MAVLGEASRSVASGRGSFLHVLGEAGIGKTSLLGALVDDLATRGVPVRRAGADETDRLRHLAAVRALLPELADDPKADPVDTAIAAVERRAAGGPLALVADDLHWADDLSVDVLRAVARRTTDLGVLVVTAARPHPASPAGRRLEEAADAAGTCLRPCPLDDVEIAALVRHHLGQAPGPRLTTLLAAAAGNPFLARELLTTVVADGQVVASEDCVELAVEPYLPEGLSRRMAARVLRAVPDDELLLRAVAAVPGGATPDELAGALDRPLHDVVTTILGAVAAGVLVDAGSTVAFRHELLRRAVVETTPAPVRRALARRVAEVMLERGPDAERVTACLLAGTDPADPSSIELLIDTGRRFADGHPAAAAALLGRAVDGLPPRDPRLSELVVALGWALVAAGRAGAVAPLLAERLGPIQAGDPVALRRLWGIAVSLTGRLDLVAAHYEGIGIDELIADYDPDDPEVVDAAAELGLLRISTGDMGAAADLVAWVEASATPASAFRCASVAAVRSWLAAVSGRFEEGAAHARAALSWVDQDVTGRATPATPTLTMAIALDQLGQSDAALALCRSRMAGLVVPRWGPPLLQFFTGLTLFRRGDWDDALAEVEAGLLAADEVDLGMGVFWPYAVASLVASAQGRAQDARAWLAQAERRTTPPALGREWLAYATAMAAEAEGDIARAADLAELVTATALDRAVPALLLNGGPELVRICLCAGRTETAAAIRAALVSMSDQTASPVVGAVRRWADGLVDGVPHPVAEAAEVLAHCQRMPEAGRARHHAAVLAADHGDEGDARNGARLAAAVYDRLDAEHWHRQLRTDLRALGLRVRPRRQPARPATGWASLTPSEATVVSLAGDGLTNTEIAGRLYLSRRTVESHLGRVYTKLGLTTRSQLVAAVARDAGLTSARAHG